MSYYDYEKPRLATLYALFLMLKGTSHIGMVPQDMSCYYSLSSLVHSRESYLIRYGEYANVRIVLRSIKPLLVTPSWPLVPKLTHQYTM